MAFLKVNHSIDYTHLIFWYASRIRNLVREKADYKLWDRPLRPIHLAPRIRISVG